MKAAALALGLVVAATAARSAPALDRSAAQFAPAALRSQVQALHRARAHSRLDGRLARVANSTQPRRLMRELALPGRGGDVRVVIEGHAAAAAIRAAGGTIEARAGSLVQALLPPTSLLRLAAARGVREVRPPATPFPLAVPGEGVAATNASVWQNLGVRGAGVKVGIIDGGFGGLGSAQFAGDVPANAIKVDFCGGDFGVEQHGTAVAEIVAEEAPAAQLYLICIDSEVTLAQAEAYAAQNGIQIVNHSIGWFNTWSGDGRGPAGTPDAVVATARAQNILWVNAAGNEAMQHWSGSFTDSDGDLMHEWAPGDELDNAFVDSGESICAFLRWNEWPNASHDYDLGLIDVATGRLIDASVHNQAALHDLPTEETCVTNISFSGRVVGVFVSSHAKYPDAAKLDLFVEGVGAIERASAAGSISDPAASPAALAVGAICWQTNGLEPYSSQGPTLDGRTKPDLVAPDSVSGMTYGPFSSCGRSAFAGTSAAAPYVAGAAALVKERFPAMSAADLQAYLVAHAGDLGAPGPDTAFGAGRLLLPAIPPPAVSYATPAAGAITWRGATLSATVDPQDSNTTVRFELGATTAYGTTIDAQPLQAGAGGKAETVEASSLTPGTQYHFRVVATNLGGTTTGADQTFSTRVDLAPSVRALAAKGRYGASVRLSFSVGDDTGEARARADVYRGATRISSRSVAFRAVETATPFAVTWHAAARGSGFRFCVQAWDGGGNASTRSCAPIRLS